MRIVAVQPDITWENPTATFSHIRGLLAHADIQPGSLIVLPEMFATGFSMHVDITAEGHDKPSEMFLKEIAKQYQSTAIGGVVTQAQTGQGLNEALAISPAQKELLRYCKIHPFTFGSEPDHFDAGSVVKTFDAEACSELDSGVANASKNRRSDCWRIAPLVCYDLRFAEVFRMAAYKGAHMLVVIANWPASRIDHWTTLLKARAIENQTYVVGVNRTGNDPNVAYNGQSTIIDPKGRVLALANDQPCVIQAQADLPELTAYREKFTALKDMKYRWTGYGANDGANDSANE